MIGQELNCLSFLSFGLVGRSANGSSYIALPIPRNCEIEVDGSMVNGTQPNDGYGVFSGTSAAAPQLACALLLERNPGLTPNDVRNALVQSARAVAEGSANPASNPLGAALRGAAATGGGLVDVHAALQLVSIPTWMGRIVQVRVDQAWLTFF